MRKLLCGSCIAALGLAVLFRSQLSDERWISAVRPLAELTYFCTNSLLPLLAAYGIQQVWLLKKDMNDRSRRAAREAALVHCDRFSNYVLVRRDFVRHCEQNRLPLYTDPTGQFKMAELDPKWRGIAAEKLKCDLCIKALNELELIAAAFLTGVADDETGFKTIGRAFCGTVATHYDIFAARSELGGYQNVRELYGLWSDRISLADLAAQRKVLELKMSEKSGKRIASIGLERN